MMSSTCANYSRYISALSAHEQREEAEAMRRLLHDWQALFVQGCAEEEVRDSRGDLGSLKERRTSLRWALPFHTFAL